MNIKELSLNNSFKVLITGGAWFIGNYLCEVLIKNGNAVRCLDNLATGKRGNLQDLIANPNFEFLKGHPENFDDYVQACSGVNNVLH